MTGSREEVLCVARPSRCSVFTPRVRASRRRRLDSTRTGTPGNPSTRPILKQAAIGYTGGASHPERGLFRGPFRLTVAKLPDCSCPPHPCSERRSPRKMFSRCWIIHPGLLTVRWRDRRCHKDSALLPSTFVALLLCVCVCHRVNTHFEENSGKKPTSCLRRS